METTIKYGLLDLSDKGLTNLSILKNVSNPYDCKRLDLHENKISVIENLDKFENLEFLNLGNNKITKINGLQDLKKLRELLLYTNQIEIIENLDSLKNLEKLNLDCNQITEIYGLDNLENLEVLSMNKNNLTIISNLESLNSLRELNLDENLVQDITSIGNLNNLIMLRMHNNDLPPNLLSALGMNRTDQTAPTEKIKAYARGEYVKINDEYILANKSYKMEIGYEILELHLGDKDICVISSIKNLTKIKGLKGLILWKNHIIDIKGLEELKELEFLYLNNNKITSLKGLNSLKNLKLLKINDNYITKIENLHSLSELKELKLGYNKIKEINGLETLRGLVILDLRGNKISEISNIDNLEQLEQLFIQNNQIRIIKNLNSLKNLKELNLSANQIEKIEGLESLTNLRRLFLSKNKIQEIKGLENNRHLIELDLSSNMISKFCGFKQLQYLDKLNLEDNDSFTELIRKINKFSSNEKIFAKNCLGYCLLKDTLCKIIEEQVDIIDFEDVDGEMKNLQLYKYTEVQPILKLLTNEYLDFQVRGNELISSIFKPSYAANRLDKILVDIGPEGPYSFVEYGELRDKLNLRNIESTERLFEYIYNQGLNNVAFAPRIINGVKGILRTKAKNARLSMEKIFWGSTAEISKTRLFQNKSGLHSRLLDKIKTHLKNYQIIEIHNFRDEISIDLLFKCEKFNWKIGISVEATSDIAEILMRNRNDSFTKTIKAKMKDVEQISDLDLFLILFCIDSTVKSYNDSLRITIADLEKIDDPKVLYIPPENLVQFFKS